LQRRSDRERDRMVRQGCRARDGLISGRAADNARVRTSVAVGMGAGASEYVKRSCCVPGSAGWLLCRLLSILAQAAMDGLRASNRIRPTSPLGPTRAAQGPTSNGLGLAAANGIVSRME